MKFKKLGNTNLKVSSICLGTMTWGEQNNQTEAFEQMDYAMNQGVNFFDTAEMYPAYPKKETYGKSEEIIGNWLKTKKNRDKIILAKEKNFKASVDEILKKVTKKTKIVFIANPNNPTGTYLTKDEMLNLRKKLRSNILLVVDDAYFEFLNSDDFASGLDLFKDSSNVLITRTFSKIYGLAGLRLGWGYCSKEIIDEMYQIKPPFNVYRAALAAGVEAIKDNEWTKRAIEHNTLWSKKIFSVLKEYNIKTNKPTANFFLMNFDETKINSDEAFEKLANDRLLLRKMMQYKIPNALRLTIGNEQANEHFIQSVRNIFK